MGLSIRPVSPFSPETRRQLSETDRRWHIKFALRLGAGLFSLIAFSLFAAAIPQWDANFFHIEGPSSGDWQDGLPIAGLTLTFLHSTYHVLQTISPSTLPRPHPLIPLAADSILLALLFPSIILSGLGSLFAIWRSGFTNGTDGSIDCDSVVNTFARECNSEIDSIGGLELGGVILSTFTWLLMLGALVLFSAPDVHRWRRARSGTLTGFRGSLPLPRDSNYGISARYATSNVVPITTNTSSPNTVELGGYYNNSAGPTNPASNAYNYNNYQQQFQQSFQQRQLPSFPPQAAAGAGATGPFEPDDMSLLKETQVPVQGKIPSGAGGGRWGR